MKWKYKIAQVWGIPIKLHVSLLILVVFCLRSPLDLFSICLLTLGALTSITLHELGHSFVAIKKGCQVREILLTPIGGIAQMASMPGKSRDELLMAAAGPATSLVLAAILIIAGIYLPIPPMRAELFNPRYPAGIMVELDSNFVQGIGAMNLFFAVFNLIPAFPMDGGRILRAGLTPKIGMLRATRIASRIGQAAAIVLAIVGLRSHIYTLPFIAALVYIAAGREYRAVKLREQIGLFGMSFWPSQADPEESDGDSPDVLIGPSPYDKADEQHSTISRSPR
jgi:Zn-dependent protease